jgi:hypothetical protein
MLTWKQRILTVMVGKNDRGIPLWYSHKKICELLELEEGAKISVYLTQMVKTGHVERARKPKGLSTKVYEHEPEYFYRVTGKPYVRSNVIKPGTKKEDASILEMAVQGHDLWRLYPTLPKWFRRLMYD